MLALAILAAADLTMGFSQKITLVSAVDRAAALISAPGVVRTDYTFLKSEAEAAAGVSGAKATISNWLECNGVKQPPDIKLCAAGQRFARYVSVDLAAPYRPVFNFGGLVDLANITVEASASVRIQ